MERGLGILFSDLNTSQQCALAAKRANRTLGCIKHSTAGQVREGTVLLCSVLLWPHFNCCVQFGVLQYKEDIKILCHVQRTTTMVRGPKGKTHEDTE